MSQHVRYLNSADGELTIERVPALHVTSTRFRLRRQSYEAETEFGGAARSQCLYELQAGQVLVNLEDWDFPCVGVRVVINDKGNRAFLSFTRDWFDEHDDDAVAAALLEDLAQALAAENLKKCR